MKRIVVALSALLLSAGVFAQAPDATVKKAENYAKFSDTKHDFGKIKQGVPVTYDFIFSNVSDKPIVIETATPSCGCTTPVWPQAPVGKGKDDKITAGFNAQNAGPFNKTITVKIAGVDQPVTLVITGEVLSAEEYAKQVKEKEPKKG
jgi:Protein of unknown function (DUF1573)